MLAAAGPEELLALDDLEPWADPAAHPVFKKVTSGLASREGVRALVLALYPVFTGRSRYALAAKVSWIGLDDGKEVFADLHRALTVPAADADAGWGAIAAALGVCRQELESARGGSHAEADDLVAIVRQHGLRSAHEAVGVAWVLDRRLPGLCEELADAARHSLRRGRGGTDPPALPGRRRPGGRGAGAPSRQALPVGSVGGLRGSPGGPRGAVGSDRSLRDGGDVSSPPGDPAGAGTLLELARAHRILNLEGHNDMSLGHLSLRDPSGRGLWLKRGNIGLEEVISEGDFILIGFDGEVLEGDGIRHLEWPIHAEESSPPGPK